jgi:hypothetical protein
MSKENGFTPIRRGIWEHVRDGRLSLQDVAVYQYIISQADTRTGIWKGSAGALSGELGILSSRAARHVLERLEHGDYIRRFARQGERFCYPILVHKFPITQGEHEGEVTDALSSSLHDGCLEIAYFSRQVKGEVEGQVKGEVSAPQRRIENGEKRKERPVNPAPDLRFGPFKESAVGAFQAKYGHPPTWDMFGRDGKALADFLRRAPHVTDDLWQSHLLNYFDSTEGFTVKQGGSLSYFLKRFDTFESGPILEGGNNNGNKQRSSAAVSAETGKYANVRTIKAVG